MGWRLRELVLVLVDVVEVGDFWGHLRAWWEVVTGRVVVG